ncbi:hypothetical protein [Rhizobium rhizogenes]|uniref:hypothetical protein n=1 Tax=Rhizobium rhizogenes TaxID=359 RepID=UPI00157340D5|nr:hypothetical protein [Rhizobium rhizogenes]NTH22965.1 transposase [Rhizobium rhizogenes]NTH35995.1 transposase [Rhizobium rhizogenes]
MVGFNSRAYSLYEPAFAELHREGIGTPPDVIKHTTALGWRHISLTGDYIWTPADSSDLRPRRGKHPFSLRDHHLLSKAGQIHHFRDGVDTPRRHRCAKVAGV